MSRIGLQPVKIEKSVQVQLQGGTVVVKGPLGQLDLVLPLGVELAVEDEQVKVLPLKRKNRTNKGFQGLVRALVANMCYGVVTGYQRKLEISGVGFRAELKGATLVMSVGFSHEVKVDLPAGVTAKLGKSGTQIELSGIDKQLVNQVAAKIRAYRPPEPYKGKGIRFDDEIVVRKAGKTGAK